MGRPDQRSAEARAKRAVCVLIIDDHKLFADAIASLLTDEGMEVLGIATRGEEGLAEASLRRPDLVLIDLNLPDSDGSTVGTKILDECPATKVVALTARNDPDSARDIIRAGFHGFLTKHMAMSDFVSSLRAALGGQVVVPRRLAPRAAGALSDAERDIMLRAEQLTSRERIVLALLVEGATSSQIAKRLSVSPNTVRTHIQNILSKLQVHSRLEAAAFATRHGLVASPKEPGVEEL